jgi:hypothetical protein
MPQDTPVVLFGGNAMIFDEYGHVKYNIGNSIINEERPERQSNRLEYLWEHGFFRKGASKLQEFSRMHRLRSSRWFSDVRQPRRKVPRAKV